MGVFSFITLQFQNSYALNTSGGFNRVEIPEGQIVDHGGIVNVALDADTTKYEYISLSFLSESSGDQFLVYLKGIDTDSPWFVMPDSAKMGEKYELKNVYLWKYNMNSDESAEVYTTFTNDSSAKHMDVGTKKYVTVGSSNNIGSTEKFDLSKFKLIQHEANAGDKVSFEISCSGESPSFMIVWLKSEYGDVLYYGVEDLHSNPYFIVPFNAQNGDYALKSLIVKYSDGHKKYYRLGSEDASSKLAYIVLQVKNDSSTLIDKDKAFLNVLDYNYKMLASMDEMDDDAIITIDASGYPLIDKGIFEVIRETRRTLIIEYFDSEWVFSGTDIVNPKSLDVSMGYEEITDKNINNSDMLNDLDKQSLMLTFANNGNLPGKALIRLKANQIDEMFADNNLFIYFYNDQNNLDAVAMEVQKDNGFYDFYIDHNSKYLLTNKKLSGSYVSSNNKYLKLNTSTNRNVNNKDNSTLIMGCIIIALLIILIFVLLNKKKK